MRVLVTGGAGFVGSHLCDRLRARGDSVPVLILTARASVPDRVLGLNMGADDYLPKPFDLSELEARLQVLLHLAVHRFVPQQGAAIALGLF